MLLQIRSLKFHFGNLFSKNWLCETVKIMPLSSCSNVDEFFFLLENECTLSTFMFSNFAMTGDSNNDLTSRIHSRFVFGNWKGFHVTVNCDDDDGQIAQAQNVFIKLKKQTFFLSDNSVLLLHGTMRSMFSDATVFSFLQLDL